MLIVRSKLINCIATNAITKVYIIYRYFSGTRIPRNHYKNYHRRTSIIPFVKFTSFDDPLDAISETV
jgi:hypothetical protein